MKTSLTLLSFLFALSASAAEEADIESLAHTAFVCGVSHGILYAETNNNPHYYTNLNSVYEEQWNDFKAGQARMRVGATNTFIQTYTVTTPVWATTNAVEIIPDHEKKVPPCTLVRYVENGKTNEFHAWACPVNITTNLPPTASAKSP